jgi:hypothetical protein
VPARTRFIASVPCRGLQAQATGWHSTACNYCLTGPCRRGPGSCRAAQNFGTSLQGSAGHARSVHTPLKFQPTLCSQVGHFHLMRFSFLHCTCNGPPRMLIQAIPWAEISVKQFYNLGILMLWALG